VDLTQILALICLAVVPFAAASVVPAWRAATSDPYESLRGLR
jgi:ABC-type lipoprotein release transport system permease subunit